MLANCDGGGITGQAGALRLGIARALLDAGEYRDDLKKAGYLTRDSRAVERKKVRPQEGPQAPAVLQALRLSATRRLSGLVASAAGPFITQLSLPTRGRMGRMYSERSVLTSTWEGAI